MSATDTEVEMAKIYLNPEHWSSLLKAVYEQTGHHGTPGGAAGQLWRMMIEANRKKRVCLEIEIRD